MGTLTVNATNGQPVAAGASYVVPYPAGYDAADYLAAGAKITTSDGSYYSVPVALGSTGITVTNPTGREIASGGFNYLDLNNAGVVARFGANGESDVLLGPQSEEVRLVSSTTDSVTGDVEIVRPNTYQAPGSNPVHLDWSLSTAGLNVGGSAACALFDARTLPNGNILYCCSRDTTANSETVGVAEINPVTREIVWQWKDPAWVADNGPESAYKLNNGNYLVCDTDATLNVTTTSHVYEITPENVKVWSWFGYRVNRIKPAYINGNYVIVLYCTDGVRVLDYNSRTVIWEYLSFGTTTGNESAVNGGDFRRINGVNYLLATLWLAATPVICLINYDTKAVVIKTSTGTATGFGPMDAQWLSDTTCIIATGRGATGDSDGTFKIARPFDGAVIATSPVLAASKTMCCNVDPDTMQMTWCLAGPVAYSTNLSSLTGWVQATSAVTFTGGGSPDVLYSGNDAWAVDDPVVFTNSGGALPAAVTSGTTYYVKSRDTAANSFTVCATLPSASAAVINMATAGTGTHTATNNIVPAAGSVQRVINRINASAPIIISGYLFKNAAGSAATSIRHGTLRIGDDPATCGYVQYDYSGGITYLDNSYNNAAGDVVIRTKVAGTQVHGLRVTGNGWPRLGPLAINVAGLTAASATYIGCRAFVNDATATLTAGIGTVVAGGGANTVPVFCDGTNWRIG